MNVAPLNSLMKTMKLSDKEGMNIAKLLYNNNMII